MPWVAPVDLFSGMSTTDKQTALSNAQAAYLALVGGSKAETVSYGQGDGNRSVTFTRATQGQLAVLINQLQASLGLTRRRPIRFLYR